VFLVFFFVKEKVFLGGVVRPDVLYTLVQFLIVIELLQIFDSLLPARLSG
jgi:hypothetical protein